MRETEKGRQTEDYQSLLVSVLRINGVSALVMYCVQSDGCATCFLKHEGETFAATPARDVGTRNR
jgi:hypothetical protein